jgi:hypothetical protein
MVTATQGIEHKILTSIHLNRCAHVCMCVYVCVWVGGWVWAWVYHAVMYACMYVCLVHTCSKQVLVSNNNCSVVHTSI